MFKCGGMGGDGYESYLQEAGQPPCALSAPPHPPPGPRGSTRWWRTPQPPTLCWPATCWRPTNGSASRWGFGTLLTFLFISIIAGFLVSADSMGENIFAILVGLDTMISQWFLTKFSSNAAFKVQKNLFLTTFFDDIGWVRLRPRPRAKC